MGEQNEYVAENFERIFKGIYSRKLHYFNSPLGNADKCVLEIWFPVLIQICHVLLFVEIPHTFG